MRKVLSITCLSLFLAAGLASCGKEYVCQCDNTSQTITANSRTEAETECEAKNVSGNSNCKLQ